MNRIATRQEEVQLELDSRITLSFQESDLRQTPTRLTTYIPLHYESRYSYPLIIWLPGRGASEDSLGDVMPTISLRNYVGVALRGPLVSRLDTDFPMSWDLSADGVESATEAVDHCLSSLLQRFNIAENRVFLAGYADGGTMAMRIGLNCPDRFAGVASLGGPMPQGGTPLSRLKQTRQLEVLIAHGRSSEAYPEDCVCDDLRLLHYAGISVTLRQYPHADELSEQMLCDLNRWAMQLVTGNRDSEVTASPFELN